MNIREKRVLYLQQRCQSSQARLRFSSIFQRTESIRGLTHNNMTATNLTSYHRKIVSSNKLTLQVTNKQHTNVNKEAQKTL